MLIAAPGTLGGMANKAGNPAAAANMTAEELTKWREMMAKYKSKREGPAKIADLSAYSLNQVQQSLDKYNKRSEESRKKNAWEEMDYFGDINGVRDWNKEEASRAKYKKGDWGIEDEYRWMQEENDFMGDVAEGMGMGMGIGPDGQPQEKPGLKPGDKGYSYEPNNRYNGTPGSGQGMQQGGMNGQPGTAKGNYDYSGYDPAALSAQVQSSGEITTGFYNKGYGASVEQGTSQFGHADLEGNMAAGITSTQLRDWFDNGGAASLGAKQQAGTGGIYDQVAAAAKAEEKLNIQKLPKPSAPPQMRIPDAMVGNANNASGVRSKRSNSSRSGRNARGTSQFNRKSFGNPKTSALTIGGLNI